MHENPKLTVAMDGPSGSGKSSVAKEVARHFGLAYLDTGAMYRAATWHVLDQGISLDDKAAIAQAVKAMNLVFSCNPAEEEIMVGTQDIREAIRGEEVSNAVSAVASVPEVREHLIALQRSAIDHAMNGMVAEGRDITTVVAPDADARILLTASEEVRMRRRGLELADKGDKQDLTKQISERDAKDSKVNNFMQAAEGVELIDSSEMDFNETVNAVINSINAQVKAKRAAATNADELE